MTGYTAGFYTMALVAGMYAAAIRIKDGMTGDALAFLIAAAIFYLLGMFASVRS